MNEEEKQVVMLSFAEQILCSMANHSKPKSRRYNQLLGAIKKLEQIDDTFNVSLSDQQILIAEVFLNDLEKRLDSFIL